MKKFIFCILLLLIAIPAQGAMTYGLSAYQRMRSSDGNRTPADFFYQFINEIETTIDGTAGVDSWLWNPTTEPSSPSEGMVYYDDGSDVLMLYTGGSVWVTIDTAGASSLGTAYTVGSKITAPTLAVEIEVADGSNNGALILDSDDTTDAIDVLLITNAGDDAAAVSIQITGTAGDDIQGTGDAWNVTYLGVGSFLGVVAGASDITLENGEFIDNGTNNKFIFDSDTGNVEDFAIGLGANDNKITFSSASSADTIDWGTMTTASGMTTITGDAADFTIGATGDSTGEDVIIQQAGTGDNQLILQSAGSAANAIAIQASTGGVDIDGVGENVTITLTADGAGDDITIEQDGDQNASIILTSDGTGGDAISFITTAATGDFNIDSSDEMDIDSVNKISIDLSGASADFDVDSVAGSVSLDGGEAVADAIVIIASDAAGGIDIDYGTGNMVVTGTGASADFTLDADLISIDGTGTSNITFTNSGSEDVTIATAGAADHSLIVSATGTGTDALQISTSAGGMDITVSGSAAADDLDISSDSAVNISSSEATDLAINISTSDAAGQIQITSTDTSADGLEIDSTGGIDIDAGITSDIAINAGQILIESEQNVASAVSLITNTGTTETIVILNSQGNTDASINVDSTAGGLDVDVAKQLSLVSSENAVDAVQITASAGGIDLLATSGGSGEDIDLTATGGSINLIANESAAQTIVITTSGGGDATETIDITNDTGTAASSTTQTDAAIQIEATAGGISLESGLAAVDAIRFETDGASATIIAQSITSTAANATTETAASIQLYSESGGIGITSDLAGANAIRIEAQGADGIITIQNILGTTASAATEEDASIQLYSQVGGIGLASALNGADAIRIEEGGGTGGTINIHANTGNAAATGAASIQLLSDVGGIGIEATGLASADAIWIDSQAGGINIDAQAAYDVTIDSGQILLTAAHGVADAIKLHADSGASQTINILNDEGTAVTAIALTATAGGITMDAADDITITLASTGTTEDLSILLTGNQTSSIIIDSEGSDVDALSLTTSTNGGDIVISSNDIINIDATNDIDILVTASGANEDVLIGTAGNQDSHVTITADGSSNNAFTVLADLGGISMTAREMFTIDVASGTAGTALITVTNTPGTDEAAIGLQAVAGGVDIDAALAKNVAITGGQILIDSLDDSASAISLVTNVGTSETIVVTNTQGEGAAAVGLTATAGGITVTALDNLKIEAAVTVNDVQTMQQDDETPDVWGYSYFNTGTNADDILDFDGGAETLEEGHVIVVVSKAIITYDVDGGALLAGTTDIVTGAEDATTWMYNGTNWLLIGWINQSSNLNNGNGE